MVFYGSAKTVSIQFVDDIIFNIANLVLNSLTTSISQFCVLKLTNALNCDNKTYLTQNLIFSITWLQNLWCDLHGFEDVFASEREKENRL